MQQGSGQNRQVRRHRATIRGVSSSILRPIVSAVAIAPLSACRCLAKSWARAQLDSRHVHNSPGDAAGSESRYESFFNCLHHPMGPLGRPCTDGFAQPPLKPSGNIKGGAEQVIIRLNNAFVRSNASQLRIRINPQTDRHLEGIQFQPIGKFQALQHRLARLPRSPPAIRNPCDGCRHRSAIDSPCGYHPMRNVCSCGAGSAPIHFQIPGKCPGSRPVPWTGPGLRSHGRDRGSPANGCPGAPLRCSGTGLEHIVWAG